MTVVYSVLARLLHKHIVLHVTSNKKHMKNEISARFLEFHADDNDKL